MTTIQVPARMPVVEALTSSRDCSSVTRALRGAATAVSDVSTWTRAHGAPASFEGAAAEAADHAMTVIAADSDTVVAALEKATAAADVYAEQVAGLHDQHDRLDAERAELNRAIEVLVADIGAAVADRVPELAARADRLRVRADDLADQVTRFWEHVAAAEDRIIAALRTVDTVAEGDRAAEAPGRVDTGALQRELAGLGGVPDRIHAWWLGLAPAAREAMKIAHPGLVGNTNGIPTGDRDEANRAGLARDLDRLEGVPVDELTDEERAVLARARAARDALGVPGADPDPMTGLSVDTNLLVYRPDAFGGDGAVAVSYGDPDTADNTAVIVPGMTNDGTNIAGQGADAYRLFQQVNGDGESAATIAWMGYDSPSFNPQDALDWPGDGLDIGSVVREDKAEAGGLLLADFVDGLRATDTGEQSHLSVIGHSYGSTTAANAAHDHGLAANSLSLIGSPGAGGGVDHVVDLGMPEGMVYVGAGDNDFVTWLGRDGDLGMGEDPAQSDFGAIRFGVDHGPEFHADSLGQGIANHTSYFAQDSQSLGNLASIVRGDDPQVVEGRTQDANDMAIDWARDEARHQVESEIDRARREIEDAYTGGRDWLGDRVDDFTGLWR